jgi:hypothetical protein
MAHTECCWTTKEQVKLYAQAWAPDGEVKAVLALVHGIGEHEISLSGSGKVVITNCTTNPIGMNFFPPCCIGWIDIACRRG